MVDAIEAHFNRLDGVMVAPARAAADAVAGTFGKLENALVDFATTGTFSMKSLADSVISDMTRMAVHAGMSGLQGFFQNMFSRASLGGISNNNAITGTLFHGGGLVGAPGPMRSVPAGLFAGAPRLHSGLASDEYPAILQRGETVIPRGGAGGGNMIVNIYNSSGAQITTKETKLPGGGMQIDIEVQKMVASDIYNGSGAVTQALQAKYGLRPALAGR